MVTEKRKAQMRAYSKTHKEERRAYRESHKEEIRIWEEAHKEERKAYKKIYNKTHREKQRLWQKNNSDKTASYRAKQNVQKLKRIPFWLSPGMKGEILAFYKKAKILSESTGTPYHVDHIVPLQGKTVSGLHVPWNLQVIPAEENLKKGNQHIQI